MNITEGEKILEARGYARAVLQGIYSHNDLYELPPNFGRLLEFVGSSRPTLSATLKELSGADLIESCKAGRKSLYGLTEEGKDFIKTHSKKVFEPFSLDLEITHRLKEIGLSTEDAEIFISNLEKQLPKVIWSVIDYKKDYS